MENDGYIIAEWHFPNGPLEEDLDNIWSFNQSNNRKREVDIFDMNNDKYNTFDNNSFEYTDYISRNGGAYVTWSYGDTPLIIFNLAQFKEYQTAQYDTSSVKYVEVTFYNSRYEELYTETPTAEPIIKITIDKEMSEDTFKRGNYYCGVKLIISGENESVITLIEPQSCLMNVR